MMKVVADTNIIISAAISPNGNPAKIMSRIADKREMQFYYSTDILAEYKGVLARQHLNIAAEIQAAIIDTVETVGIKIEPPVSTIPLPDETDRTFYDTAKASGAVLITGNLKHYPVEPHIMTPADFLSRIE